MFAPRINNDVERTLTKAVFQFWVASVFHDSFKVAFEPRLGC